jgi:acyl-CoA hydrolase/GNAT superfamily N-acetyltransferase
MIASAQEAIAHIRPGQRIFIGTGCGQPQALVKALLDHAKQLQDTEVVHLVTFPDAPYGHKKLSKHFRINSFFIEGQMHRGSMEEGLGNYTPIFLSDIPRLFRSGQLPLDVALIQVTVPNKQGICSLGISVDIVKSAVENAGLVIAQVNEQMPWTMGDSLLDVNDIDILVSADIPVLEARLSKPTETSRYIAKYIASLIKDGSTLELGIEHILLALPEFLKGKRDIGIHTEVLPDGIIELIESGVVTGKQKNIDKGKVVASLCIGKRELYDYINNNPIFSFHPAEYVSDWHVFSQQNKMVSIDIAYEVDLMGQVCADSLGAKFFSGLGSYKDFARGAASSPGGKSIIALESTGSDGTISRIVAHLSPGAAITATSREVHYIVTEFGVAYLHGKSLQERALALISIAHPNFRAELLKEAIKNNYISSDLAAIEGKILVGPQELRTSLLLENGTQIDIRPMHPTDENLMRDLFQHLSPKTLYHRFLSKMTRMPQKQIQNFVYIDYRSEMALVGTVPEAHDEAIIAIGRYYLNPLTNRAEFALLVRDDWQNRGIGTFLFKYLVIVAKRSGIAGFTGEILIENKTMLRVLQKSGCKIQSYFEGSVCHVEIDFE